jgi:hypothetical protein
MSRLRQTSARQGKRRRGLAPGRCANSQAGMPALRSGRVAGAALPGSLEKVLGVNPTESDHFVFLFFWNKLFNRRFTQMNADKRTPKEEHGNRSAFARLRRDKQDRRSRGSGVCPTGLAARRALRCRETVSGIWTNLDWFGLILTN